MASRRPRGVISARARATSRLAEAALLAGLLKAPSRLSPARDPKAAEERAAAGARRHARGGQDRRQGTRSRAAARRRRAPPSYWTGSENYVADRIMDELPDLIGDVARRHHRRHHRRPQPAEARRTVDPQRLIDESGDKLNVTQGALVSIDNSGAVRAMVGGYDYADSQFDRASEARRQPGSAFKPFVYLAALEAGRTPDSVRNDAPIRIGNWTPDNYGGKYYGKVTLATALAKSLNSVAAQLAMEVGPDAVVEAAHRLGIEFEAAGQHLDRARHLRGDAARAHRGLCAVRQWRLQAGHPLHPAHHHRRRRGALRQRASTARRASSSPRSSA